MIILLFFAFLSGIVTILSPCILPVLPVVLSGSVGGKRRPFGVILGFIVSFSVFTLALSALVQAFNIPPDALRIFAVAVIIAFGLIMMVPKLQQGFELLAVKLASRRQSGGASSGFGGGLVVGLSLGLVWTPCVGPIMASVISLAVTRSVDGGTLLIILAYSLGTAIPMLGIMLGGRKLIKRFAFLSGNGLKIQRVFGVLMVLVGLSMAFGLDRRFQSAVLQVFPGYGTGLTTFENIDPVRKAIRERSSDGSTDSLGGSGFSWDVPPKNGRLGDYGQAPALVTAGQWFNTGVPLTMESLKGKVVLLDFWTYSCVNCVRTIPHLRAWDEAYRDQGLVIIGVHTPEFAFERDPGNVQRAMKELGVTWPVVLDNQYAQWSAYNNRYWPAKYFIDAQGRIRYFHFGEGEYETTEDVIRALLKEAGNRPAGRAEKTLEAEIQTRTAETYLGYARAAGFVPEPAVLQNRPEFYRALRTPGNGEWTLAGEWTVTSEYIVPEDSGVLELGFYSKNVFLVIQPQTEDGWIEVMVDGEPVQKTPDFTGGILRPRESRLYQLTAFPKPGEHVLNLKVHGELRLFAFTFG